MRHDSRTRAPQSALLVMASLIWLVAAACSAPASTGIPASTTGPTHTVPTSPTNPPAAGYPPIEVTGLVTSADTSAPLAGVTIYLNGRYHAVSDAAGHYDLPGLLDLGPLETGNNILWTVLDGYDNDTRYVRLGTQDFRLHAIHRFAVGTPLSLAVSPDDSLCDNNVQDPGFGDRDYVCRVLHTTTPSAGTLTVDAVSAHGQRFSLVVQSEGHNCCEVSNPVSFAVRAGAEVVIWVELPSTATTSDSFLVSTRLSAIAGERRE